MAAEPADKASCPWAVYHTAMWWEFRLAGSHRYSCTLPSCASRLATNYTLILHRFTEVCCCLGYCWCRETYKKTREAVPGHPAPVRACGPAIEISGADKGTQTRGEGPVSSQDALAR